MALLDGDTLAHTCTSTHACAHAHSPTHTHTPTGPQALEGREVIYLRPRPCPGQPLVTWREDSTGGDLSLEAAGWVWIRLAETGHAGLLAGPPDACASQTRTGGGCHTSPSPFRSQTPEPVSNNGISVMLGLPWPGCEWALLKPGKIMKKEASKLRLLVAPGTDGKSEGRGLPPKSFLPHHLVTV